MMKEEKDSSKGSRWVTVQNSCEQNDKKAIMIACVFYGKEKINERKIKVSNLYKNRMKIDRFFFLFTAGFFFVFTVGDAVRSIRKKNKVSLFVIKLKRASGCVNAQIKKKC